MPQEELETREHLVGILSCPEDPPEGSHEATRTAVMYPLYTLGMPQVPLPVRVTVHSSSATVAP